VSSTPKAPEGELTTASSATSPGTDTDADAAALTPPHRGFSPRRISNSLFEIQSSSVFIAAGLVLLLFAVTHPSFFSTANEQNVLQSSAYVGVMACGMAFLIAMRQLDLSVSSQLALTAGIMALLINDGWNPWIAALIALAAGGLMGLFNAFLVQTIGINALLATLATLYAYNGLQDGLTSSNNVNLGYNSLTNQPLKGVVGAHNPYDSNSFFNAFSGNILGIPEAAWIMLAFAIVLTLILRFTPFGYRVRSIGSNPEAATFSGISIPRVTYQSFFLVGIAAGLGGVLTLLFFHTADPSVGGDDNLLAIAAVIIGGTPMRGGTATVFGAMIGAILLTGMVNSGLTYFNISENWTLFVLGVVILAAVSVDSIVRASRRASVSS
jgi:ribose transport system permease protein